MTHSEIQHLTTVPYLSYEQFKRALKETPTRAVAATMAVTHSITTDCETLTCHHIPLTAHYNGSLMVCDLIVAQTVDITLRQYEEGNQKLAECMDLILADLSAAGFTAIAGEYQHAPVTMAYTALWSNTDTDTDPPLTTEQVLKKSQPNGPRLSLMDRLASRYPAYGPASHW